MKFNINYCLYENNTDFYKTYNFFVNFQNLYNAY